MIPKDLNIPINRVTKRELLYYLYPIEYICKLCGFEYETDKITDLILHIENEVKDGTPREVICRKNCDLINYEVQGHNWSEWTCIATGGNAPLGRKCTVTEESYTKISEREHRKKWGG